MQSKYTCDFCLKEKDKKDIESLSLKVHMPKKKKKVSTVKEDSPRSMFSGLLDIDRPEDEQRFEMCLDCQRSMTAVLLDNRAKKELAL